MIYRYSCTTLNYIISVVYKWKLSPDLWITIWTENNTMLQGNNVNALLLIFCDKITFTASKVLTFNTVITYIIKKGISMVFVRRQHCS
jgi:hypothetical protein